MQLFKFLRKEKAKEPIRQEPKVSRRMPAQFGQLRSFMAASNDRLVADLARASLLQSGNAEVRGALRILRGRSRTLSNDSEYPKRVLSLYRQNVIGAHGIGLQMKIQKPDGTLDRDANAEIERAWAVQSKQANFSADGRSCRASFERAAIHNCARDGEVIIEKCYSRKFKYGIAFRFVDPDLLDETLNVPKGAFSVDGVRKANGTQIRMGVEVDEFERPVAYWFRSRHPGDDLLQNDGGQSYVRKEAKYIIHAFLNEQQRPGVYRGIPWMFAAIRRVAMLLGYEEAALVNARVGASKMLYYKQPDDPADEAAGGAFGEDEGPDERDFLKTEMEAGSIGLLPKGWSIETWDPTYPNDQMQTFVKQMLRAFSAGMGINYNSLSSDLEGVSLSSLRHGANADRDTYEELQHWFIEQVETQMFESWLEIALDIGAIGRLPGSAFDRLNFPQFFARQFRSPDPQKDVAADAQAVALGIKSRTQICNERGVDFEEVLEELALEEKMATEKGVTLNTHAATSTKNPAVDDAGKVPKKDEFLDEGEEGA